MNLSKSGWVLSVLAITSTYLLMPEARESLEALRGPSFPDALLALTTLVQLLLSLWVLLAISLTLLGGSSRLVRLVTPRILRRALFAGAVGALTIAPAHAETHLGPYESSQHSLSGMRLPDRPSMLLDATAGQAVLPSLIVQPGDSLWVIATQSLPAGASVAEIAEMTTRWYDANRAVIGPSPHLIFPGQQLTRPLGKELP